MTTENLKAVLTEEEWEVVGLVRENPGHAVTHTYVWETVDIISRLADELVRLRDILSINPDGSEMSIRQMAEREGVDPEQYEKDARESAERLRKRMPDFIEIANCRSRIRELEAGDYMEGFEEGVSSCQERIRELEAKLRAWEDAPRVEVSGQALVDYTGDEASDGTYHLKPKEAQGDDHDSD